MGGGRGGLFAVVIAAAQVALAHALLGARGLAAVLYVGGGVVVAHEPDGV